MKLITFIFLVSVAMGQTNTRRVAIVNGRAEIMDDANSPSLYDPLGSVAYISAPDTLKKFSQVLTIASFVQLLDEYAQECYNDSTESPFISYSFVSDSMAISGGHGYLRRTGKKEYWHNTKPTFHGFREFLKRKGR